jgi:hypothetical protein
MNGLMWAVVVTALVVSLAALGLGLVLAARYRQLHERVASAAAFAGAPFPSPGAVAPLFDTVARDGSRATHAQLSQGRAVVAAFDTNCSACQELLPEIGAFLADTSALVLISGAEAALAPYLSGLPTSARVVGPATPELIAAFGIRAFPTILLYQDGVLIAAGSRPADVAVPAGP